MRLKILVPFLGLLITPVLNGAAFAQATMPAPGVGTCEETVETHGFPPERRRGSRRPVDQ